MNAASDAEKHDLNW